MLISTPAIILHAFPYGETSRIVRLATRDHGVQSGLAKGAQGAKSRFGGRLQILSEGVAQYYYRTGRELNTLSAFDVTHQRAELAHHLGRYAAALAAAELVLRFAPADPHPALYDTLAGALDTVLTVEPTRLAVTGLAALWQLLGVMGFAPAVDACAQCGEPAEASTRFAIAEGGFLCRSCATGRESTNLGAEDAAVLRALVRGDGIDSDLSDKHARAHRRLLARFVQRHVSEDRPLGALAFWESGT
ncbi:MAG: DNA repair protein RecO [Gemmatimonadales bacterium]